jgi:2-amino-4-hydroxy-6-hydroxymethyldihydropteridine diphosphokinase
MPTIPEPSQRAVVALGGNLGDRQATLEAALTTLHRAPGIQVLARSRWYRSAPVGPPQPDYLNGCALLAVRLTPEALLENLQETEQRYGRVRGVPWGPRTLDLDLIFYGALRLESERLWLPHPRLRERAFVLLPLAEIAPEWVDPVTGRTVAQLARGVEGRDTVVPLEQPPLEAAP